MRKSKLITLLCGVTTLIAAFACVFKSALPTMKEETVSFASHYKTKDVTLKGSYWNVDNSKYGVLLCPGYSCDRQKWKSMASLFVSNGCTTMSFDYSGQGASTSTIGFDNAKSDALSEEIADAIEILHEKSNIDYKNIVVVGHSMGGRSILRLLYDYNNPNAVTKIQRRDIGNVILMAPEVNYYHNAQSSLFAGTSDANEEPWKSFSADDVKGTNVYLYGSTADDIVSDKDILAIYEHCGIQGAPKSGVYAGSGINKNGDKITVGVAQGILHSFQMFAPTFGRFANEAIADITGASVTYSHNNLYFVHVGWFLGMVGFGVTLYALTMASKSKKEETQLLVEGTRILDCKAFLLRKLLMWIPGIIVALVIMCIAVCMPFGSPIMNIPYMCFIAGYGVTMLIHFARGRFKGTEGKLPKLQLKATTSWKKVVHGIGVTTIICAAMWFGLWSTVYRLIPGNWRIFWVFFAGTLMSIGYYISSVEGDMLKDSNAKPYQKFLYQLIEYVPLFLFVCFYAVIGSWSGFVQQMINVVLMYVFCIPLGNYMRQQTGNRLYGALVSAFTFQTIMITSAALISFF